MLKELYVRWCIPFASKFFATANSKVTANKLSSLNRCALGYHWSNTANTDQLLPVTSTFIAWMSYLSMQLTNTKPDKKKHINTIQIIKPFVHKNRDTHHMVRSDNHVIMISPLRAITYWYLGKFDDIKNCKTLHLMMHEVCGYQTNSMGCTHPQEAS